MFEIIMLFQDLFTKIASDMDEINNMGVIKQNTVKQKMKQAPRT